LTVKPEADADMIAALIDGIYLREALSDEGSRKTAQNMALLALNMIVKDRR
jgi:TetR/AcrR family transcriptional repressor of bet genes